MKKILLAIDSRQASWPALDFACYLGKLTHSPITSVLLRNIVRCDALPVVDDTDQSEDHVSEFADACCRREVAVRIHRDNQDPASALVAETKNADVLIVDPDLSFNKRIAGSFTTFAKDLLKRAACPLLIAPSQGYSPRQIIFTCNGTTLSLFSIKQLTFLFPEWHHLPVTVVQISKSGITDYAEQQELRHWLSQYYKQLSFETIKGDAGMRLFEQLTEREGSLLVLGAFGRTALSRLFKRSHANQLLRVFRQPVFISNF